MDIRETATIPAGKGNNDYVFNRAPLAANPMAKLPLGAVKPAGWLKRQLELMAVGMTGKLPELSKFLASDNGWFGTDNEGWEEQPYWFRGFYCLARLTGEPRLLSEAERWIEAVLGSQNPDGYFGARIHKNVAGKNGKTVCDLWPHMVMLDAVTLHHEATGDERVVPFMTKFFRFCAGLPDDRFIPAIGADFGDWKPDIQRARSGDMLPHMYWLYNRTGEPWLLALAARFFRHIAPPADEWLDHHVINFTQRFAYPGIFYTQSLDPRHLSLSEYWYAQHLGTWGQQPRGIFGADENIRPGCVDPRQGFETCGFGEFAKNFYMLGRLTGNAVYADRVEDLLFNHFPASQTPDLKALHYLTASNQPQLDASINHEYQNRGRQIDYSPHLYRCCQHNVAMTWPWFAGNLWQATSDGGLAAWMYSACEATALAGGVKVVVREDTEYPFRGKVVLAVSPERPCSFPLYLRAPRWCGRMRFAVNGEAAGIEAGAGGFARIEREWSAGDRVELEMPMELSLTLWPRTGAVTVDRGPLSYSIKIEERWRRCGGSDDWPEWEAFPAGPWNYGLALDPAAPLSGFRVREKGAIESQPWTPDSAPVEIEARARRIPGWKLVNETADVLRQSPVRSEEALETVTLIPLGCARLRMSCLPVAGEGADATDW